MLTLSTIDLSKRIEKKDYKDQRPALELKIGELQRKARAQGIPLVIVFEGWGAAGKGTQINNLMLALDPRGFNVNLTKSPTEEEFLRPFLWRFWTKLPTAGRIAIFDRSWYRRVLNDKVEKVVSKEECEKAYHEIITFERQLIDQGTIVIKFFLHITKKEQKNRFAKLLANPATAWKVSKNDRKQHSNYTRFARVVQEMLDRTSTKPAPWTIVEAVDNRFASVKIMQTIVSSVSQALVTHKKNAANKITLPAIKRPIFDSVDLSLSISREEYEEKLKKCQTTLREIEHEIYIKRIGVLIAYEGWDAAGKGGNIRRLVQGLDPRGYEVVPVAAPNDIEKTHHYLWRFWQKIPKAGHITIFDRTWYGRVMVERIEKFCSENEWKRAYAEINEFEEQLANSGIIVLKFWLHIDQEEQLRRFTQRQDTPYKSWKITEEDWRNREKWLQYKNAVEEMISRTNTEFAPWTIVEANCKYYARIKTMQTVIEAVGKRL